jgi:predicted acylesterase/phospholipase RssA
MHPDVYASVSGGGPAITYLAGAASSLAARARVLGWAGASAGALVAACKAFAVADETIVRILVEVLSTGRVLNPGLGNIPRGGIFDLDTVGAIVDANIGKGARLGDASVPLVVCVTDLDRARPVYLGKATTPRVKVREALIASSSFMCGVTPAATIPSLGTELSPDVRLWGDGGLTDNTVDGVWDGLRDPRVALRLARHDGDTQPHERIRDGDVPKILAALPRALMWGASTWKSRRMDGLDVEVDGVNDWSFKKTETRILGEWADGYDSTSDTMLEWLRKRKDAEKMATHDR